jgi:hypothetical protein
LEKAVAGLRRCRQKKGHAFRKEEKSPFQPSVTPLPGQLSEYKQLVLIMRCGCMLLKEPCIIIYSYTI